MIRIIYGEGIILVAFFIINEVSSMKIKAYGCSFMACKFRIESIIIFGSCLMCLLFISLSIFSNCHQLSFCSIQHQALLILNIMLFRMLLGLLGIVIWLYLWVIWGISFYWIFVNLFIHLSFCYCFNFFPFTYSYISTNVCILKLFFTRFFYMIRVRNSTNMRFFS